MEFFVIIKAFSYSFEIGVNFLFSLKSKLNKFSALLLDKDHFLTNQMEIC